MPLPGSHNYVTLSGTFLGNDDTFPVGQLTFVLNNDLLDTTDLFFMRNHTQTVTLVNGSFSISLLATDDAFLSPAGWGYTVTEQVSGEIRQYTIKLPYSGGSSQNLINIAQSPSPSPALSYYMTAGTPSTTTGQVAISSAPGSNAVNFAFESRKTYNVMNYGAKGDGTTDDTAAFNAAILAITGAANPATNSRIAKGILYMPAPSAAYKITSDLLIQSTQGFVMVGDGTETTIIKASGTGFTTAIVLVDGSYHGKFEDFTIIGDGTEAAGASPIPYGLLLTKTSGASRSSTGNQVERVTMRNLSLVVGIANAAPAGTTNQIDGTSLTDCVLSGGGTAGGSYTTKWLTGYQFGNGTFGNQYNYVIKNCGMSGFSHGVDSLASGFEWYGGQPANNGVDFNISGAGAPILIDGIQSQQAGQFLVGGGGSAAIPVQVSNINYKSTINPPSSSTNWIAIAGGAASWLFENVLCNVTVYTPTVSISGSSRIEVASFVNFQQFNSLASGFVGFGSTPSLFVANYSQLNSSLQTLATTPWGVNTGGGWVTSANIATALSPTFITATGNTAYSVPSTAQSIEVILMSGGGGGGSGAFNNASSSAGGGGGGGGGGLGRFIFQKSDLGSSVTVTVGAGGAGGAAVTGVGSGNVGVAGGSSLFGAFGWVHGGAIGGAGTTAAGGGGGSSSGITAGQVFGGAGATGGFGNNAGGISAAGTAGLLGNGGGGGGGANSIAENGGDTGTHAYGSTSNKGAGGIAGGAAATAGTSPPAAGMPGSGAGGGASAISGAAQQGADAFYGGGGGGGGACAGGTSSGRGGNGGNGFALIIPH